MHGIWVLKTILGFQASQIHDPQSGIDPVLLHLPSIVRTPTLELQPERHPGQTFVELQKLIPIMKNRTRLIRGPWCEGFKKKKINKYIYI